NSDCNDDQIQYLDSDGDGFGSTIQVACGLANNLDCNDTQLQYLDADGDGFGRNTYVACGVTNNSDCNDDQIQYSDSDGDGFGSDIQVACGLANSNDCDDNQLQYLDADGDTFGRNTLVACGVTNNTDCNDDQIQYLDFDGDSFGSNTQVACGVTNNIDCNDNQLQYLDADADGFGSNATVACGVANNIDCNDDQLRYADTDGDGFGSMLKVSCNGVLSNTDCNDGDVLVWQSNALYIDEDQDGYDGGTEIVCYGAAVPVPYMETTNGFDCNDNNNTVHPGVFEILDNGIDDDCNGMTDAVPYCTVPTTWNGTVWSNNYPVADQPAIIAGNFTAISDLQACSLTVTNNAQVVVLGGNDFKITGAVVVDPGSTLTFESNANLVQVDQSTNSGNIKVKRATTMRRLDYTYWASPVNNQMLLSFSPQTIANRFMTIDETSNAFVQQNAATTSFAPAVGYAIRAPNNFTTTPSTFTGIFTGVPRNGDYSILASMNNQGYNLIGNPYPSTVDGNLFLAENPGTMYFWTHNNQAAGSGENYSTYTTIGGTASASGSVEPNGSIQVGQGFVFRPDAPGMANFTNAMRIGNNQNQFFRTAQTEKHRIWLNLAEGESPANQMLVAYATNATVGEDAAMDGRMMPTNSSSISSLINNGEFVIQARPVPFEITDEVPLSFNAATNGTYTISIDHTDGLFSGDQHIFLRDNLSGAVHDLKNSAYSFASVSGSFTARFSIIYQNAPLEIQNPSINEYSIVAFKRDGVLHIESGSATMERIKVFDVRGRQLLEKDTVRSNNFVLNDLRAEQQVLIVQVTDDHGVTVSKKVVF
ncbi:T9SS sorting signal type C domain-containing protein, partial [Flavobacterium sp.]|uniref:T9SS sorting signal type C domain-containing protein n=1 Tax=Flavobacterium sp. TaxID=239 RepID=UPI002618F86B